MSGFDLYDVTGGMTPEQIGNVLSNSKYEIDSKFDALQAMVQGRLTFETKAQLDVYTPTADSNGQYPLAEVWADTYENNGLYGYNGTAWVSSPYDVKTTLSNELTSVKSQSLDADDEIRLMASGKVIPLSNDPLDFIWGVKAENTVLGYFDSSGKWYSDHDHDGLPSPAILTDQADIVWGVKAGGTVLGYFDSNGKWHSDHDHAEFDQLRSEINSAVIDSAGANDWLAYEDSTGATSQIVVNDGSDDRVITKSGYEWKHPVVHSKNIIRCFSDYTTGALKPHTILPTGEIIPEQQILMQQLVTGQSLSLGSRGYVLDPDGPYTFDSDPVGVGRLFTTECPPEFSEHCLTLNNGVRKSGTTLVPTAELPDGVLGETVCSSFMIALAGTIQGATNGSLPRLAAAISGIGGVSYDSLKKGTSAYSGALARVSEIKAAAIANGWQHVVSHLRIIHGESQHLSSDPADRTESGYAAVIRQWVSDYQADILAITAQPLTIPGVLCQMNTGAGLTAEIPLAQLKAATDYPDVLLIGPKYQFPYHDEAHMLAEGYVKLGEQESHVIYHWLAGRKWQPLMPESVTLAGSTVTVSLNNVPAYSDDPSIAAPVGDLVIDQSIHTLTNCGFELTDTNVSILSVSVGADKKSIEIELSAAPSVGTYLTYAMQSDLAYAPAGPRGRGCIRDSDARVISRFDNQPVHNWLVTFRHQF